MNAFIKKHIFQAGVTDVMNGYLRSTCVRSARSCLQAVKLLLIKLVINC